MYAHVHVHVQHPATALIIVYKLYIHTHVPEAVITSIQVYMLLYQ